MSTIGHKAVFVLILLNKMETYIPVTMVAVDFPLLLKVYKTRFHTANVMIPFTRKLAGKHIESQEVYTARLNQSF